LILSKAESKLKHLLSYVQSNRKELERFAKFMVVGAIGAVVDFGTFNFLIEVVAWSPALSGTISFVLAVCSNFIWNRYWTYPDSRSKPVLRQFVQFFFVNALGIAIRLPIVSFLPDPFSRVAERGLGLEAELARSLGNNVALALAVVIVMFWNFFVNRFWTYRDVGDWGQGQPISGAESAAVREGN
jgi:putative flippase GtrA